MSVELDNDGSTIGRLQTVVDFFKHFRTVKNS